MAAIIVHDSAGTIAGAVDLKKAGTTIDIIGGGFKAGEAVTILLDSTVLETGSITANSGGAFAALGVEIPSGLKAGDVVSVKGAGSEGTVGWGTLLITDKDPAN